MNDPAESFRQTRREIFKVTRELSGIKSSIEKYSAELDSLGREVQQEEMLLEQRVSRERVIQMEEFRKRTLAPFTDATKSAEIELSNKRIEMTSKLGGIRLEDYLSRNQASSSVALLQPQLDLVYEKVRSDMGDDFTKAILDSFPNTKIKIDSQAASILDGHFKNRLAQLESKSMDSKLNPDKVGDMLESTFRRVLDGKGKLPVLGVGAMVTLMGLTFFAPVYLPYTVFKSVQRMRNVKLYRDLLYDYSIINNNLGRLLRNEKLLAEKQYQNDLESTKSKYEAEISVLDKKVQEAKNALRLKEASIQGEFKFSDEELQQSHAVNISSFTSKKDRLKNEIQNLTASIPTLERQLIDLNAKLQEHLEETKNLFLSTRADQFIVPDRILIKVDDKSIETIEYNPGSSIVFCDSKESMNNFSTLWMCQIRAQMHLSAYKILVFDTKSMGSNHAQFFGESKSANLFDDQDKVGAQLKELQGAIRHRIKYCTTEFQTLQEYNQSMLDAGSVIESYKMVFLMNPTPATLSDPKFIALLDSGTKAGIYVNIFVETMDITEDFKDLFRYANNFYSIEREEIIKLAEETAYRFVETATGKPSGDI